MVDLKVMLYDGSYHDVDSSEMAFKIAGSLAFKAGVKKAGISLLEPMMKVSAVTPSDYIGPVTGDLNSRRARIMGTDKQYELVELNAEVPLAEMFGYATDLRSATQGRATFSMEFSHYEPAPRNVMDEVVAKAQGKK